MSPHIVANEEEINFVTKRVENCGYSCMQLNHVLFSFRRRTNGGSPHHHGPLPAQAGLRALLQAVEVLPHRPRSQPHAAHRVNISLDLLHILRKRPCPSQSNPFTAEARRLGEKSCVRQQRKLPFLGPVRRLLSDVGRCGL